MVSAQNKKLLNLFCVFVLIGKIYKFYFFSGHKSKNIDNQYENSEQNLNSIFISLSINKAFLFIY